MVRLAATNDVIAGNGTRCERRALLEVQGDTP